MSKETIIPHRERGRVAMLWAALTAASFTLGCASTSNEEIAALSSAEAEFAQAQSTPRIEEFASRSMQSAERSLDRAQSLAEEGAEMDAIEHHAYMAERHLEIASARLQRGLNQEEIASADRRRQELVLAAEKRQAARSQAEATAAQMRAEEAEARLAITKQELQETRDAAKALASELDELKVKQDERGTVFTLSDVVFDLNSAELNQGGERSLERIAQTLKEHPKSKILVEGYTDSTGSEAYNADLSERRAKQVKSVFVNSGIPTDRISVEGYGERYPVASNDTAQGRQLNRRVEIVVSDDNRPVAPRS